MTQAQRTTEARDLDSAPRHYDAGGHVAVLQANLIRQLRDYDAVGDVAGLGPVERLAQFCSRTGGYALLAMGYAVVGILIANWL